MQDTLWGKKAILSTAGLTFQPPKIITTGRRVSQGTDFQSYPVFPMYPLWFDRAACHPWYVGSQRRSQLLWKLFIPQYLLRQ